VSTTQPPRRHRARDRRGRFNAGLQRLVNAGLAAPSRISRYADTDPTGLHPGDRVFITWIRDLEPGDTAPADLYVIGCLWWGRYTGDDVARSNHRSLLREFPNEFVHLHDAIGTAGLALLASCRSEQLLGALLGLAEYPLFDEDDNGALIRELADEAWDAYLHWDVPAMLRAQHRIDTDEAGIDDERLREMFYRIHSERFGDEYAETALSVVFPCLKQTVAIMADELRARTAG
jgi:hypothetical protein